MTIKQTVKRISGNSAHQTNEEHCINIDESSEYQNLYDKVLLENSMYEKLFRGRMKKNSHRPWKRGIVKIEFAKKNIYRLFHSGNKYGIKAEDIGLTTFDFNSLDLTNGQTILVSKGSRFYFYWNHPDHHSRAAFKLGLISVILGATSLFSFFI